MILAFNDIETQRRAAGTFIVAMIWVIVPMIAVAFFVEGDEPLRGLIAGLLCASFATGIWRLIGETAWGRSLIGVVFMSQISILVAGGGPWQIDLHMAYFAALGLLIIYNDWRVIVAAAATVAVHHLTLGFIIPEAVFAGSASFGRVGLHAAILVIEAVTLVWVTLNLNKMFGTSRQALALAEKALADAAEASRSAEQAHAAEKTAQDQAGRAVKDAQVQERSLVVNSIGAAI